jgi:predicted TIM-barrel enzyme
MVLAIFVAFLGVAIALFTVGTDILWMIVGAATGGVTGYLIGKNMDNAVAKNK